MSKLRLINADCLSMLYEMPRVKSVFLDPPDNLGLNYDDYKDDKSAPDYYNWLELVLTTAMLKADIVWVSYYPKHDLELKYRIRNLLKYRHPAYSCDTFLWRMTFSQYNDNDCAYGYRPIVRLLLDGASLHVNAIREDSVRMKMGDKRAAGPRVPDNVWEHPRVVGNAKERRPHHPTQHPEALMERIIKLSCDATEEFVDLFAGTGTSLRVCKRLGIPHTSFEISKNYCEHIARENGIEFLTPVGGLK